MPQNIGIVKGNIEQIEKHQKIINSSAIGKLTARCPHSPRNMMRDYDTADGTRLVATQ